METAVKNIDEYIAGFPAEVQKILETLRETIRKAAPDAEETISYGMPAFKQNGILVYFAAFKNHIGFFPTGSGKAEFQEALSGYKGGKGTIQFPINQPLPLELISDIVKYRVGENLGKRSGKRSRLSSG